jgi:hypothetical protein
MNSSRPRPRLTGVSRLSAGVADVRRVGAIIAVLAAAWLLVPSSASATISPRSDRMYVTDGEVHAMARVDNTMYIGGKFASVGLYTGAGAAVDAASGTLDADMPTVDGTPGYVFAVVADGSGGWYIGGSFNRVGGLPRANLAHILADKSVDPAFDPGPNNAVDALTLAGSKLYVGGAFTSIGGRARSRIAAVNTATGVPTGFDPGADGNVHAIVPAGSTVYLGGFFASVGGQPRANVAAVDTASGDVVPGFEPNADEGVFALAVSGSTVYVGGAFTSIGGQPRNRIAALSAADGTALATFDPGADGPVYGLALNGSNTLYVGGAFLTIGGVARGKIAALSTTDGSVVTSFNATNSGMPAWEVDAIALSGSTLYLGGNFVFQNHSLSEPPTTRNLVAVDATTGALAGSFQTSANGAVDALAVSGSTVYAGGEFTSVGLSSHRSLAAIDLTTGAVEPGFKTQIMYFSNLGTVDAIAADASAVYIGGRFSGIQPVAGCNCPPGYLQDEPNFAKLDPSTGGVLPSFAPAGANGDVHALALSGSTIYVGGQFGQLAGQSRSNLGAVDTSTGSATSFSPTLTGASVLALALATSGSTLYVGGSFGLPLPGGGSRADLVAFDTGTGNLLTAFDPQVDSTVWSLAPSGSALYVGGDFTTVGGQPRGRGAAVGATSGAVLGFDARADDRLYSLQVSGSKVYAGGAFLNIGGQARQRLAELDATSGDAAGFDPAPHGQVRTLQVFGSKLYAGGEFDYLRVGGGGGFAAFGDDISAPSITIPTPAEGARYRPGQTVLASYSCGDADGVGDVATCSGPVASGAAIDTTAGGPHTFTVDASDWAANTSSSTSHYTVDDSAPTINVTIPGDGERVSLGQVVPVSYLCSDADGFGDVASCDGPVPSGSNLDTATPGDHSFTVNAADIAGNPSTQTSHYYVDANAPEVSITAPADGARYTLGQHVLAAYSCVDDSGPGGIATCDGPVASGTAIDTGSAGSHTFTVHASDKVGHTAEESVSYTVDASAPALSIVAPADGATYTPGQSVPASYACTDPDGAADVASCSGPVGPGAPIDTAVVGPHTFTVNTVDRAGNAALMTVSYSVAAAPLAAPPIAPPVGPPGPVFMLLGLTARSTGSITVTVKAAVSGTLDVLGTTSLPKHKTMTFGKLKRTIARTGQIAVTMKPSRKARAALHARKRLRVQMKIAYTPKGATPVRTIRSITVRLRTRPAH